MKAWMLEAGSLALDLADQPDPAPGPGQVLIEVMAASLNRGEFLHGGSRVVAVKGVAQVKRCGMEAAGVVKALGEGVTRYKVGDRVMGRAAGGFAELTLLDERHSMPVPDNIDWITAGSIPIAYAVAYDMIVTHGELKAGDVMLVNAVASGVGVACLQIGKALGAKVIGTSGSASKLEALKAVGLDEGVLTRGSDFVDAVKRFTDGKGVQLAINNIGGSVFEALMQSLAYMGRLAQVGHVDGVKHAQIDVDDLHSRRLKVFGVSNRFRTAAQRAQTIDGFIRDMLPLVRDGRLRPLIDAVFPFDQLPQAVERMRGDAHVGKIVLKVR